MIPTIGFSFGRTGGRPRRYPGGTGTQASSPPSAGRSRIAALPRADSAPPRTPLVAPALTVPRLSSLRLQPSRLKAISLLELYSGPAGLPGRLGEGFLHRRSHPRTFMGLARCQQGVADIPKLIVETLSGDGSGVPVQVLTRPADVISDRECIAGIRWDTL
jgi:hypothetical protein